MAKSVTCSKPEIVAVKRGDQSEFKRVRMWLNASIRNKGAAHFHEADEP